MSVSFDFTGRRVLVTGGTSGLGLAMARAFATAGADVTITGRRASASDYDTDLAQMRYFTCEMGAPEQITALAAQFEQLDVLVNNAGQNFVPREWDPDVFDESLRVNLGSAFRLSTACHDLLAAAPHGAAIVNVASLTSFQANDFVPSYGAAKAGVVQMTMSLASAWAEDGIRVNAVAPGVIETPMTSRMVSSDAAIAPVLARTPLNRIGQPAEIAPTVLFLASDAARFLTGQTIAVDGGFLIRG